MPTSPIRPHHQSQQQHASIAAYPSQQQQAPGQPASSSVTAFARQPSFGAAAPAPAAAAAGVPVSPGKSNAEAVASSTANSAISANAARPPPPAAAAPAPAPVAAASAAVQLPPTPQQLQQQAMAAMKNVSLWDIILYAEPDQLAQYITFLSLRDTEAERRAAAEGLAPPKYDDLTLRVLDQRVEQSLRFKLQVPVFGSHGYQHVLLADENAVRLSPLLAPLASLAYAPKGATPLHFVVMLHAQEGLSPAHRAAFALCARRLVEAGADFSLTVEPNLNALLFATELKNVEMAALLRGYRGYHQKVRRHLDAQRASVNHVAGVSQAELVRLQTQMAADRAAALRTKAALRWRWATAAGRLERGLRDKDAIIAFLQRQLSAAQASAAATATGAVDPAAVAAAVAAETGALTAQVAGLRDELGALRGELANARAREQALISQQQHAEANAAANAANAANAASERQQLARMETTMQEMQMALQRALLANANLSQRASSSSSLSASAAPAVAMSSGDASAIRAAIDGSVTPGGGLTAASDSDSDSDSGAGRTKHATSQQQQQQQQQLAEVRQRDAVNNSHRSMTNNCKSLSVFGHFSWSSIGNVLWLLSKNFKNIA